MAGISEMNLVERPSKRPMTREWLISLRRKALRKRVWFSALTKIERSVVELSSAYVDQVSSSRLALVIGRIACKLLKAFKSRFLEHVYEAGQKAAGRFARIAVSWGYVEASEWKRDPGFVRYLGYAANEASGRSPGRGRTV
jgi:hypothetical protein